MNIDSWNYTSPEGLTCQEELIKVIEVKHYFKHGENYIYFLFSTALYKHDD